MREEQRYPHQHRHTETDRQEQRVLEKETEAGYKRGGESIETQGSRQRGTDNRFRFAQGEGERRLSTETPSTWQNRRGTGWWRDSKGAGERKEGGGLRGGLCIHTTWEGWPPWCCNSRKVSSSSWLCSNRASWGPTHPDACRLLLKHTLPPLPSVSSG